MSAKTMNPNPELRVYKEESTIYVVGTNDTQDACRAAGISPETHQWSSTNYGHVVRRKGQWRYHPGIPNLPKDARPCVSFHGPIKERDR